jgi:hypothetical protein
MKSTTCFYCEFEALRCMINASPWICTDNGYKWRSSWWLSHSSNQSLSPSLFSIEWYPTMMQAQVGGGEQVLDSEEEAVSLQQWRRQRWLLWLIGGGGGGGSEGGGARGGGGLLRGNIDELTRHLWVEAVCQAHPRHALWWWRRHPLTLWEPRTPECRWRTDEESSDDDDFWM